MTDFWIKVLCTANFYQVFCVSLKVAWILSHHLQGVVNIFVSIAGRCQKILMNKKFVDNAKQCFAFTPQANFATHNLNFH